MFVRLIQILFYSTHRYVDFTSEAFIFQHFSGKRLLGDLTQFFCAYCIIRRYNTYLCIIGINIFQGLFYSFCSAFVCFRNIRMRIGE